METLAAAFRSTESPPVPPSRHGRSFARSPDVEHPGPGRAEQRLMPRKRQQIDALCRNVDRNDARCLRGIDEEQGSVLAHDAADFCDRLHGPEDVGRMGQRDEPRFWRQCGVNRGRIDGAPLRRR